jgi:hypothetical protein
MWKTQSPWDEGRLKSTRGRAQLRTLWPATEKSPPGELQGLFGVGSRQREKALNPWPVFCSLPLWATRNMTRIWEDYGLTQESASHSNEKSGYYLQRLPKTQTLC